MSQVAKRSAKKAWKQPSFLEKDDKARKGADRLKRQVKDYADGTSIHGIKYTLEPGRSPLER